MLKDDIKEYFLFTRKERRAILILTILVSVVLLLPYLFPSSEQPINKAELKAFEQQVAKLKAMNTDSAGHFSRNNRFEHDFKSQPRNADDHAVTGTVFYFDPNTLSPTEWKRLGLRDKTIKTIEKYLSKGGQFKKPEDIRRIYGLSENDADRLLPYVRINTSKNESYKPDGNGFSREPGASAHKPLYENAFRRNIVDLNTADTNILIALPGIGSKLASRIISFRSKLGGFYAVDQLSEVYGLADSTFHLLKPRLTVATANISAININSSSLNDLKQHPYLKQNLAAAIIEYRNQHGNYQSIEDLKRIDIIPPEVFEKIAPYLKIN